jgi:hypothetical protein
VGGGIGTGAGTGVEVDKKNEADGAAENIGWAGRAAQGKILAGGAAAEQANCILLISGETVTLKFLKKSMPRMGPATTACRKVDIKSFLWNCTVFLIKPQEGMGCPSAPLRRGPDGLEFWLQGTLLKVAPESPNTCHWSIRQFKKSSQHLQENA